MIFIENKNQEVVGKVCRANLEFQISNQNGQHSLSSPLRARLTDVLRAVVFFERLVVRHLWKISVTALGLWFTCMLMEPKIPATGSTRRRHQ